MPLLVRNHIHLHYAVTGVRAPRRPPVVFLHGLGSSSDDWMLQVPAFSVCFRVITIDLRAHGRSSAATRGLTIEALAEDVDALLSELGETAAHVVGLSLGGCVALALALRHASRVHTLTLVNTFARYRPHGWAGLRQGLMRLWLLWFRPTPALARYVARGLFPRPEQRPLYEAAVASLSRNNKRNYFATVRALGRFDVEARLADIRPPTLVVAGDRDATVPLRAKELLASSIPEARLVLIPDSGHATPYDQPRLFNRTVVDFLSAH